MLTRMSFFLLLLSISFYAHAEMKDVTGKITRVQIMGQNFIPYSTAGHAIAFFHMDELPASCGTPYHRVAITSDHPAFQAVVSAAMTAKVSNSDVHMFYIDQCTLFSNGAWDFAMFNLI